MAYDFESDQTVPGGSARGVTVKLHAERMQIEKTPLTDGAARLRKKVVSAVETFEVPVVREEVTIERRRMEDAVPARTVIGDRSTLRVPISAETFEVRINAVVTEAVKIGKRQVSENKRFSGSLRHEELQVEEPVCSPQSGR